jgi:hypothetical protein
MRGIAWLGGLTAACAAIALAPGVARADETTAAARAAAARELARPHTMVELNTGFLLLPGALVCPQTLDPATCKRGEFSLVFGLQNFYRFGQFAVGGGIQWATTLRSDAALGDPSLEREHSRRYFLFEALGRWYFLSRKSFDWWAGVTLGGIIVNDSWSSKADREPASDTAFVGPRAATLGTEGFTLGACIGGEWSFAPNWSLGPSLRYSNWFLPDARKMSPTGDVASLGGRLDMIDVGVRIAYRISL